MPLSPHAARRRQVVVGGLTALAGLRAGADQPEAPVRWPDQPVRVVSPVAPGSGLDDLLRRAAQWLGERLHRPVVVETRQGANTSLAAAHVATARPDGSTLLYAPSSTMVLNPFVFKALPYRPLEDFAPVAKLVDIPVVLVVAPEAPWHSAAELVAAARQQPHRLNFGYTSNGYRAMGAALARATGMDVVQVPYRSMANLMPDLKAGRIDFIMLESSTATGLVQSGQLRGLGVLGAERLAVLPQVPTLREGGLLATPLESWIALFAPARTPRDLVEQLSTLVQAFMRTPQATEFARTHGLVPAVQGPQELQRTMLADQARWRELVERAGIERE
jgi:tripartite-type tricarboxylate transporter receptor subunit TctC